MSSPVPSVEVPPAAPLPLRIAFDNTYARLPDGFHQRLPPTRVRAPRLVQLNIALAQRLGLDPGALAGPAGLAMLSGNGVAAGSEPLAQAYAGHQFGHFVPQLGDGRANLLGEVVAPDGVRFDMQLKGAGRTPFSRRGDGRAALGPVLREYVLSEAMAELGVPTTRALAAVTTGEPVVRETLQPGAVLTRIAASHLRVGTFQFFAARGDVDALRTLADYAIARHYPEAAATDDPYRAFLDGVVGRQARLVAQWMLLGFIHGVMNTDNTSISGETIDYGPCAFLEAYEPGKVYSSIDAGGRYAYRNQPFAMQWNVARLAECLLPLLAGGSDEAALTSAREGLERFMPQYEAAYREGLGRKLGLQTQEDGDAVLGDALLQLMAANAVDFTAAFRALCAAAENREDPAARTLFQDSAAFDRWAVQWRERLSREEDSGDDRAAAMRAVNPVYIPRNHLVQEAIEAATEREDFTVFQTLLQVTEDPYREQPGMEHFSTPALPDQCVLQTFCGT